MPLSTFTRFLQALLYHVAFFKKQKMSLITNMYVLKSANSL